MKSMQISVRTRSSKETERVGETLAACLSTPIKIALIGDLGTGKTTFTRGLARGFGIEKIRSPSFTLINIYRGEKNLYHVDLYRLSSAEDIYSLGLQDALLDPEGVVVVEWAEKGRDIIGDDEVIYVYFEHLGSKRKSLSLRATGERGKKALECLEEKLSLTSSS